MTPSEQLERDNRLSATPAYVACTISGMPAIRRLSDGCYAQFVEESNRDTLLAGLLNNDIPKSRLGWSEPLPEAIEAAINNPGIDPNESEKS